MSILWTGVHVCTPSIESPVHAGPHPNKKPLKTPVRPPVPTLPKNWKPISMKDDQTTNLKLADTVNRLPRALCITQSPLDLLRKSLLQQVQMRWQCGPYSYI
jgi:hypothetical protein